MGKWARDKRNKREQQAKLPMLQLRRLKAKNNNKLKNKEKNRTIAEGIWIFELLTKNRKKERGKRKEEIRKKNTNKSQDDLDQNNGGPLSICVLLLFLLNTIWMIWMNPMESAETEKTEKTEKTKNNRMKRQCNAIKQCEAKR